MNGESFVGKVFGCLIVLEYLGVITKISNITKTPFIRHNFKCVCSNCGSIVVKNTVNTIKPLPKSCKNCRGSATVNRKISRDVYPDILLLREQGKYLEEIAQVYGVTRERIRQILRKILHKDSNKLNDEKFLSLLPVIRELVIQKYTYAQIAEKLNITISFLGGKLLKHKIEFDRPVGKCLTEGCNNPAKNIKNHFCSKHDRRIYYVKNQPARRKYLNEYQRKRKVIDSTPETKCSVEGCDYLKTTKGLCQNHYYKVYNKTHKRKPDTPEQKQRKSEQSKISYQLNKEKFLARSKANYQAKKLKQSNL